ncbi:MAG: carboxypeptidase regulatory-like domain-containing protein, partial [Anaerolineales bacterium]|nr:carboxypeptidase regulatory-like domain-containing protein [Anaerolineales bacterium]
TWTTYTEGDGLASNYVQAIAIDRHGHKWFGTDWAGVSRFDGTTWTTYNIANGLIDNQVYAIAIDSQDNKWFGTVSGVGVLLAGDAPATYSISGRITDANGSPVAGVSVSAGGAGAATDGSGAYTLTGLITGTYTLTPAKIGWTFMPPSRTVGVPPSSTGQDFTAASASGLQLTGLEVTQGIQNLENDDVILIQDRPTFVRAHVQSGAGIINGVTAVLIGRRNGSDLPGSPLRPANVGGQIDVLAQPDRLQLDDSFYFELPAAWRSGTVELTFQGDSHTIACAEQAGTPGDCRVQVAFTDSPAADVRFVGIVWRAGGTLHQPAASDFDAVVQQINATLPIPDLAWDHPYDVEPVFLADAPTSGFDFARINLMLKVNRTLDGCVSLWPVNCTRYYLGVLIDPPADRLLNGMAGGIPADVASAYVLDGFTHPHELSHAIGRAHTDYNAQRGIAPPESGAQYHEPTAGTISQATAGDGAFYGFDIGARVVYGPETADLMSYGRPRWPSPWTYTHTRDHLVARYDARLAPLALLAGEPAVVVSGVVSPTAGAGSLTAVYAVDAPVSVAAPPPGAYAIRFEDGAGQALAVHSFAPDMVVEDRLAGAAADEAIGTFTLLLPWPANAARIVLLHNGQPLAAQAASSGAPSISVTYPNGGELLSGGTAVLRWTAVDPDGDPLTYAVQYSRDAGMSWQTLASTWPTTTYAFNLDAAAGSDQALVRVLASDGFHTAQDSSDATFTVATHPPRAVILGPAADSLYVGEQTILLNGRADDNEDGRLPGTALSWASSLDGALGTGESVALTAAALTEGTHAITLTAQDGDGQIGTASLTLHVSRDRPVLPAQLTVAPAAISFLAAEGAGQSAWQALSIRNAGDGALSWSAAADQSWIELQAPTGAAPGALAVAVNPAGLPIGTYSGTLTITANGAAGSPRVVEVVLHVREPYWLRLPIVVR